MIRWHTLAALFDASAVAAGGAAAAFHFFLRLSRRSRVRPSISVVVILCARLTDPMLLRDDRKDA